MKEELIKKIIFKLEKPIGPIAGHLAKEIAKKRDILKNDTISPPDQQAYTAFLTEFTTELSKITDRDLVERTLETAVNEE